MKRFALFSLAFALLFTALPLLVLTGWRSSGTPSLTEEAVGSAPEISLESLPLDAPESAVPPMESLEDPDLQRDLEAILREDPSWQALSRHKKLSLGVVDMHDPLHSRFAAINGDHMMYAASLPKIAVLLAAADALDRGALAETPEIRRDMRLMIAQSDNAATSRMIERVGMDHIARVLQDPCYNLYDRDCGGGLWVGKLYGRGGQRKGDPMKNLSHAATVSQVCKYYYKLAFGQLVTPARSRQMLEMLADPELHHKFVHVLDRVAPDAKVYRKSGTWKQWHADSALVWDKTRRYIIVALAEDAGGEVILRKLMRRVDAVLTSRA
ncbi:MAG: serine hydrolase [Saprospiraceae bacterium]|nr:serine hydrolase [Saprospiraceae bacterium]